MNRTTAPNTVHPTEPASFNLAEDDSSRSNPASLFTLTLKAVETKTRSFLFFLP